MAEHEETFQVGIEMQVADMTKTGDVGFRSAKKEESLIAVHLIAVSITAFLSFSDGRGLQLSSVSNVVFSILAVIASVSALVIPAVFVTVILTSNRSSKVRWLLAVIETIILAVHLAWLFPAVS